MKCPICRDPDLVMTNREGIEIDYCPQCRGVWLDRGELDKIIERSTTEAPKEGFRRDPGYREESDSYYRHRKPKSVWKELFDF
ncbi:MAG TPA: zf-TFIIB domain-containing protein [Longimicrobiaceae bacterium]|nr:zf-TFIIB domain-containing protein [Longimicrobiaceae bacterium]